jgi:uncharacterized protein
MTAASGIEVLDDEAGGRYVAMLDGDVAGFATYEVREGRRHFLHTEVDDRFEGRGVGSALARGALSRARAAGQPIVPRCPFIAGYIDKHPEWQDLVDRDALDRPGEP